MLASADAATVEFALEALDGMGDVTVRRRNQSAPGEGFTLLVTYKQQLGNAAQLTATITGLYCTDEGYNVFKYENTIEDGIMPTFDGGLYVNSAIVSVSSGEAASTVYYNISGLETGLNYHVRVSAWNGVGNIYGNTKGSYPALVQASHTPSEVQDVTIAPL